jgi:hypothetical protein
MSIQDIVRDGTGEHREISPNMKKTLFIGLGGTGKEVLMRLRRKFYNASENKYGYDFIRYLWIDTDVSGSPMCDENWNVTGENISFGIRNNINEVFDAHIQPDILNDFYKRVNTYVHIRHWFPADALKPLGYEALKNGAKGIRPLGRLAFAWHSASIQKILQDNLATLNVQFNIEGIEVDNAIDVYVVGSLAGGTGSGMFLELAKMLKANWPTNSVYGVFFPSDMFEIKGDNEYRDANCYAALQELDFYQTASNSLDPLIANERHLFEFIDSAGGIKGFNLPLYSNVFLITNEYYNAPGEKQFSDPFEMVSEIFYYDFDKSDFGAQKRSQTVNTRICGSQASVKYIMPDPKTGKDIGVESSYHSDYSSFALSGIFLNITQMKNWASYKYLVGLFTNLLKNNPANSHLYEKPGGSFAVEKLNFDEMLSEITHGSRSNSVYEEYIDNLNDRRMKKQNLIYAKIAFDHTSIAKVQQVCDEQFNQIDTFINNEQELMDRELTVFKETSRPTLEKLTTNLENGLKALYSEIERLMYEILANYQSGGISIAEQMLTKVHVIISQMSINSNNYANETKGLKNALVKETPEHPEIHIDSRIIELLQKIQDCNEIPMVFPGYKQKSMKYFDRKLKHDMRYMNREIQQQLTGYFDARLTLIKARFHVLFREKTDLLMNRFKTNIINLVDAVEFNITPQVRVTGLRQQIRDFRMSLTTLQSHYLRYEESLRTEISIDLTRKMILDKIYDKEKPFKDFLMTLDGDTWFVSQIASHYLDYVNNLHIVNTDLNDSMQQFVKVLIFYKKIQMDNTLPEIKSTLKQTCRGKFNEFMQDKSVLEELTKEVTMNSGFYRDSIRNMLSNFNFRLALSQAYTQIRNKIETNAMVRIVGLPAQNQVVEDFLSTLGDVNNIVYHGSPEGILFYSETFGFPLFMLKNIEHLKSEFKKSIQSGDNNKFYRYTDIVTDYLRPLAIPQSTTEMTTILSCWEALYEAIVLRIINYNSRTWHALLINKRRFDIPEDISFGKTLEASISKLNTNNDLLELIRSKTDDVFAESYTDAESVIRIWLALYANYIEVVQYINDQFGDVDKPKIPQEYVLENLLGKYLNKYAQIESIEISVAQKKLVASYQNAVTITSGYSDHIHKTGLKIYPQ